MSHSRIKKIVVIGMGPVGLAFIASAMNEAKKNNQQVEFTVIEKRGGDFSRKQRLIDQKTNEVNNLTKEYTWEELIASLISIDQDFKTDGTSTPKALHFLKKLKRQNQAIAGSPSNLSVKELQNVLKEIVDANIDPNMSIKWMTETTIQRIDLTNRCVQTKSKDDATHEYEFDYLIDCEGSNREVVDKINTAISEEQTDVPHLEFTPFPNQLPTFNAACLLAINLPNDKTSVEEIKDPQSYKFFPILVKAKLEKLGWQPGVKDEGLPYAIIDTNFYKEKSSQQDDKQWKPKLYIASFIPEKIANMADKEQQKKAVCEWLTILASQLLKIPPEYFELYKFDKEQTLINTFTTEARYVNHPVLTLPNDAMICLIGDAKMDPVYQAGISSTIGATSAALTAKCIFNPANDKNPFQPLIDLHEAYQKAMQARLAYIPFNKAHPSTLFSREEIKSGMLSTSSSQAAPQESSGNLKKQK